VTMDSEFHAWDDSEWVMISALEHWSYCPRQCALIHLEQTFDENLYTLRGRMLHEPVDTTSGELSEFGRIERGLSLWSERLGLVGKADVVEFHGTVPYPVEYKHGPTRRRQPVDLQLCAQAVCLEEMMGQEVPKGAIFHHASRRRREVIFSPSVRLAVEEATCSVRRMLVSGVLPKAVNDKRCELCSLKDSCLPGVVGSVRASEVVIKRLFEIDDW